MYVVSACLLGRNCRYNGGNCYNSKVEKFLKDKEYMEICPEMMAGFKIPRNQMEWQGDKCIDINGNDYTDIMMIGARWAYDSIRMRAFKEGRSICAAILKSKSPTCGVGRIYDGTFQNILINGDGAFARILKEKKILVVSENLEDLDE